MYVTEGSGNGETRADFAQLSVRVINIFRLGVQSRSVHVAVVHAVFFATGATQFDFQSHANFGHARQVFGADFDVFVQRLFRQVNHVRREQRFTGSREVFFTRVQQTVDPRQQFLRAVVSVQDNRHAVVFSHLVNVMRARDSAQDCRALRYVSFHAFTRDEGRAAVGKLNDDRCFNFCSGFQNSVDGISAHAVNCRQSKIVFFCYLEHFLYVITSDHAWFYEIKNFRHVSLSCIVGLWEKTRAALNVRSAINQRAGIPARNDYFLARSSSIATAGRTLPSTNSRNAPPPVEM
ncbi:Uncharacterised protein [Salmonella enterica subsp. enterica serovar Typhi]|nr:Uncharacterised protein [Salmonella enterica subsp. enterica serovar Typhi]